MFRNKQETLLDQMQTENKKLQDVFDDVKLNETASILILKYKFHFTEIFDTKEWPKIENI